jgi:hypothetical protein
VVNLIKVHYIHVWSITSAFVQLLNSRIGDREKVTELQTVTWSWAEKSFTSLLNSVQHPPPPYVVKQHYMRGFAWKKRQVPLSLNILNKTIWFMDWQWGCECKSQYCQKENKLNSKAYAFKQDSTSFIYIFMTYINWSYTTKSNNCENGTQNNSLKF